MRSLSSLFAPSSAGHEQRRYRPALESLEERTLCTTTPLTATWFESHLNDADVCKTVETRYLADQQITRNDMIAIFREASSDGEVSKPELHDLRFLCAHSDALQMPPDVANLSDKVVNFNPANKKYHGHTLAASGQLKAGDDGAELDNLVNKWFLGKDHPADKHADNYERAAGSLFGPDGPRPSDVAQGAAGDCYFLAPLAAIARNNPKAIRDMITENPDGTFTVRFFQDDGTADYVTVDRKFPAKNDKFVEANDGARLDDPENVLWVAVMEKAYAQLAAEGWSRAYSQSWDPAWSTNSYRAICFGDGFMSLEQLTGQASTGCEFSYDAGASARNQLIQSLRNHEDVVALTLPQHDRPDDMPDGIISSHFYAVTSYNSTTREFTLMNPSARGERTLHLTWSQLTKWFDGFSSVSN